MIALVRDQLGRIVLAWRLADGKQAWRTERSETPSWGSPTIYRGEGQDELITNGTTIRGYDPRTGKELWQLGPNSEVTVAHSGSDLLRIRKGFGEQVDD